MPLSSEERLVIFETAIIPQQIQKYLSEKKSVTFDDLRNIFSDVSQGAFLSYLLGLKKRKTIEISADFKVITYTGETTKIGNKADRIWKAACLKQNFIVKDLEKITECTSDQIGRLCKIWAKNGYIECTGRVSLGGASWAKAYKMLKPSPARPILHMDKADYRKRRKASE